MTATLDTAGQLSSYARKPAAHPPLETAEVVSTNSALGLQKHPVGGYPEPFHPGKAGKAATPEKACWRRSQTLREIQAQPFPTCSAQAHHLERFTETNGKPSIPLRYGS